MNDLDICKCGDYRKNHVDGKGLCRVCSYGGVIQPRCTGFRFAFTLQLALDFSCDEQLALDFSCDESYTTLDGGM